MEVTEDWCVVAGCTTVRKPIFKMRWTKTLMRRLWVIREIVCGSRIGSRVIARRLEVLIKEVLVDLHLGKGWVWPRD